MAELVTPLATWDFPENLFQDSKDDTVLSRPQSTIYAYGAQSNALNMNKDSNSTVGAIRHGSDTHQESTNLLCETIGDNHRDWTQVENYNKTFEGYCSLKDHDQNSRDLKDRNDTRNGLNEEIDLSWYPDPANSLFNDTDGTPEETESVSGDASKYGGFSLRRTLRPQQERGLALSNAWLDKDDTGDYDPVEEQRQLRKKRRRVTKNAKCNGVSGGPEKFRPKQNRTIACEAPKKPTILQFRHVAKKLSFAKLAIHLSSLSESSDIGAQRRLRATEVREHHLCAINAEHNLPDDLTGHPIRRGCYECASLAERCSLLDDERGWPCQTCQETGKEDCELIAPPVRKLACQLCKRQRIPCSFVFTRNQGESCHACNQRGFRCIAGPVKDLIQPRIRYERDWQTDPLSRKKKTKICTPCLECSEQGHDCSLSVQNDELSSCKQCQTQGLPCTIGHNPILNSPLNVTEGQPANEQHETRKDLESPTCPQSLFANHQIPAYSPDTIEATIQTSFAHPMRFNATDARGPDCHFCREPRFAIFGLGRTRVAVADTHDRSGWLETCGGHRAASGIESTRLCTLCTTHRLRILLCEKHSMRQLPSVSVSPRAKMAAVEALVLAEEGEGGSVGKALDLGHYCSLCSNLAEYECETVGKVEEGGDFDVKGCGLKLCERCMLLLVGTHDGRLVAMLDQVACEPSAARPFGFRADCELLRQKGPLVKYFAWMCQQ